MAVCVKVADDEGVTAKVPLEEGNQAGRVIRWAGCGGGNVDIYNCDLDAIQCDHNAIVFRGTVTGEKVVCWEREVWGVLSYEEG